MQTNSNDLAVFTHGKLTRSFSFLISGIALYLYVRQFFVVKGIYENLSANALLHPQSAEFYNFLKIMSSLSLIAGFFVVLVIFYTLVDVWGLKVIVTPDSLIVLNTLFKRFPGSGIIPCEEIVEIKKGIFRFKVIGKKNTLTFSGVERIDLLFHLIYECKKRKNKQI